MNKLVLLVLLALVGCTAEAAPIVSPATHVINGTAAPTAGSGRQAAVGTLYANRSTGDVYVKTTTAATGWTLAVSGTASDAAIDAAIAAASATPSVAITRIGAARTKNLTTEGTLDWFALTTASVQLRDSTNTYWKQRGGWMFSTYDLYTKGQTGAVATFASTQSSTVTDQPFTTALSSTAGAEVNTVNSTVGYGMRFCAPSSPVTTRQLLINVSNTSSVATLTATLDDSVITTASTTNDSTASTESESEYQIDFVGGTRLCVTWNQTSHHASPRAIAFQNATLANAP
jgi:hypothetical protein